MDKNKIESALGHLEEMLQTGHLAELDRDVALELLRELYREIRFGDGASMAEVAAGEVVAATCAPPTVDVAAAAEEVSQQQQTLQEEAEAVVELFVEADSEDVAGCGCEEKEHEAAPAEDEVEIAHTEAQKQEIPEKITIEQTEVKASADITRELSADHAAPAADHVAPAPTAAQDAVLEPSETLEVSGQPEPQLASPEEPDEEPRSQLASPEEPGEEPDEEPQSQLASSEEPDEEPDEEPRYQDDVALSDEASMQGESHHDSAPSLFGDGMIEDRRRSDDNHVIFSLYGEGMPKAVGDVIGVGAPTVADTLDVVQHTKVEDIASYGVSLREVIGVNDRFLIVRDLFGGDQTQYDEAIDLLEEFDNLDDALIHIDTVYQWDPASQGAKLLMELLMRKLK
ncbi:hypothetical protein FACS1894159_00810 [Bacteroidia bacterium]|nr:hypothetical protein FACS1894159_00810 [Bacteroidia bacterium]